MRSGYNPARRNRNIGTAAQGHGSANCFAIPASWRDTRAHWEKLGKATVMRREIESEPLTFLVEQVTPGFAHHCSVGDVCHLLGLIPADDWHGISLIAFRQPTRKQSTLAGIWARLAYWADFGVHAGRSVAGPAVIIEAVEVRPWHVQRHGAEIAAEVERLRQDGHMIGERRRKIEIQPSSTAIRNTQLYRSLLHEIGHWVHWNSTVLSGDSARREAREKAYFRTPQREREGFAHRYADHARMELQSQGLIPFAPITDEQ